MDKELWKKSFTQAGCPPWPCPVCNHGVLTLIPGLLREKNTNDSMKDLKEDWWDSSHVVLTFSAWAVCSNKQCEEEYAITGTGKVDQVPKDEEMREWDYVSFFTPKSVHPTLRLFVLPHDCPAEVVTAMESAFALYWQNKPATAGRIRVALERLLDHLEVPSLIAPGKFLPLDARIDQYSKSDPIHGAQLMALKWLGNVGSHTVEVDNEDLLDAFAVFEHVLAELIGKRSAAVAKLAADLTEKYKKR